jgi:cysteine desulfurase/selenocysteine lyase
MSSTIQTTAATAMTPAEFRSHFPGAENNIYMDVSARGVIPRDARDARDAREALDEYLDTRLMQGGDKAAMFETTEGLRQQFARFVGAAADEVAYTKNVSEGLNAIIAAFDWQPGDRIVYCPGLSTRTTSTLGAIWPSALALNWWQSLRSTAVSPLCIW